MAKVKIPRQWKFGSIPEEILFSNLSIYAKVGIGAIMFHSYDDGPSWPGAERLAQLCSCSKRRVLQAIKELENAGFLKVEREHGKANTYEFLSKSGYPQSPVAQEVVTHGHPTGDSHAPVSRKLVTHSHPNETLSLNETQEQNTNIPPSSGANVVSISNSKPKPFHVQFVDWFGEVYPGRWGGPYSASKADFTVAHQNLVGYAKSGDLETLKAKVRFAWTQTVPQGKGGFVMADACMTVKGFCAMVNRITIPKKMTPREEAEQRAKRTAESKMESAL